MAKVTMPQLGESVAEGTIGKWLKKPGDHVDKYEPLLEVITDKVNAEVPSPFEGVLTEILVEEGATVPNNAEIAVIETARRGRRRSGAAPADDRGAGPGRRVRERPGRLRRATGPVADGARGPRRSPRPSGCRVGRAGRRLPRPRPQRRARLPRRRPRPVTRRAHDARPSVACCASTA